MFSFCRKMLCMVSLFTLCAAPAFAEDTLKITLVEDPWPPYINGQLDAEAEGGLLIDLYREIFSRIEGVEVHYHLMPWKRALSDVAEGTHDGIIALFKTPERMKVMAFTDPIFSGRTLLWYSKDKFPAGLQWASMEDLIPYHIVMLRGSAMGRPLVKGVRQGIPLRIDEVTSHAQQLQLISRGRYDVTPLTEIVGYHLLKEQGIQGRVVPMEKPLSQDDLYYMAFSKKSPAKELIPRLNVIINDMKAKGEIDQYIGVPPQR